PIAQQLAWDAQWAPENVGLSHNVQARTSRQEGQTVVEQILHVNSVDLVADPATTQGLFESAEQPPAAAQNGAAAKRGDDENALRESASTEARQQRLDKRRQIQIWVRDSRLPSEAATVEFLEALKCLDLRSAQALIQERAHFYRSLSSTTGKPKSKGPTPDAAEQVDVRRGARL